jgi:hypothetical protein
MGNKGTLFVPSYIMTCLLMSLIPLVGFLSCDNDRQAMSRVSAGGWHFDGLGVGDKVRG